MLLSFAFCDRDDLSSYRAKMPCGRLMIDSGAFTASTTGRVIKKEDYAAFLQTWEGVWDHAVTLDVIGDPRGTAANTRWLHSKGLNVMPVFTRGGKIADFDAMVKDHGYVCVGGGIGMPRQTVIARLSALQRRARDLGGGIHALGVGNTKGMAAIKPYSCDASKVSSAFRWGTLIVYDRGTIRILAHSDLTKIKRHALALRAQGVDLAELVRSGRQPTGPARGDLMRGISIAFVAADEDVQRRAVPTPHGVKDFPGTHLYSAVTGSHLAPTVAGLDELIHGGEWSVPLWDRYKTRHKAQCRKGKKR
jgi:hypothetical protein